MTILVTGPESSGKTTLARRLAAALDGVYVAEAARAYLHQRGGRYVEEDLPRIWAEQARAEDEARASGASFVICDTGPVVMQVWAEVKYGHVPAELTRAVRERTYDLVFVCTPDLPWEPDPLREAPDEEERQTLFERYRELLPQSTEVSGRHRLADALNYVLSCRPPVKSNPVS